MQTARSAGLAPRSPKHVRPQVFRTHVFTCRLSPGRRP